MAPTILSETCITTTTGTLLCIPNDQDFTILSTSTLESWRSSLPCNNNNNNIPEVASTIHSPKDDDRDWQHYLNDKISHILNSRSAMPEPAPAMLLEKRKKKPSGSSSNTTSAAGHMTVNGVLLWAAVGGVVAAMNA